MAARHATARREGPRTRQHSAREASRLARDLTGRFGSGAYAAEELVAELGAAFALAALGLATEPREDHARCVAH